MKISYEFQNCPKEEHLQTSIAYVSMLKHSNTSNKPIITRKARGKNSNYSIACNSNYAKPVKLKNFPQDGNWDPSHPR